MQAPFPFEFQLIGTATPKRAAVMGAIEDLAELASRRSAADDGGEDGGALWAAAKALQLNPQWCEHDEATEAGRLNAGTASAELGSDGAVRKVAADEMRRLLREAKAHPPQALSDCQRRGLALACEAAANPRSLAAVLQRSLVQARRADAAQGAAAELLWEEAVSAEAAARGEGSAGGCERIARLHAEWRIGAISKAIPQQHEAHALRSRAGATAAEALHAAAYVTLARITAQDRLAARLETLVCDTDAVRRDIQQRIERIRGCVAAAREQLPPSRSRG